MHTSCCGSKYICLRVGFNRLICSFIVPIFYLCCCCSSITIYQFWIIGWADRTTNPVEYYSSLVPVHRSSKFTYVFHACRRHRLVISTSKGSGSKWSYQLYIMIWQHDVRLRKTNIINASWNENKPRWRDGWLLVTEISTPAHQVLTEISTWDAFLNLALSGITYPKLNPSC
jgi:hypothetical protein